MIGLGKEGPGEEQKCLRTPSGSADVNAMRFLLQRKSSTNSVMVITNAMQNNFAFGGGGGGDRENRALF